jgi:hypothetical protein
MMSTILAAPMEVRLRIYQYLHLEQPRISIYDENVPIHLAKLEKSGVRLIPFENEDSPGIADPKCFTMLLENYEWDYLLTCKKISQEARDILPPLVHLRVLSKHWDLQDIREPARRKYVSRIATLTVAARFPLYNNAFDGSEMKSLEKVFILDADLKSKFIEHHVDNGNDPLFESVRPKIFGQNDGQFIDRSLRKLHMSKMHWWQCEKRAWLHDVLTGNLDVSPRFTVIYQQFIELTFESSNQAPWSVKRILLVGLPSKHVVVSFADLLRISFSI